MKYLLLLPLLLSCSASEIPAEFGLLVTASAEAHEMAARNQAKTAELAAEDRKGLQDQLVSLLLEKRWIAASENGMVPLSALPDIEAWARTERLRNEAESEKIKENLAPTKLLNQSRRISEAMKDWIRARNSAASVVEWNSIIQAIRGVQDAQD